MQKRVCLFYKENRALCFAEPPTWSHFSDHSLSRSHSLTFSFSLSLSLSREERVPIFHIERSESLSGREKFSPNNKKTAGFDKNMKYQGVLPENHRLNDGFQEERPDISCFHQNRLFLIFCFFLAKIFPGQSQAPLYRGEMGSLPHSLLYTEEAASLFFIKRRLLLFARERLSFFSVEER